MTSRVRSPPSLRASDRFAVVGLALRCLAPTEVLLLVCDLMLRGRQRWRWPPPSA